MLCAVAALGAEEYKWIEDTQLQTDTLQRMAAGPTLAKRYRVDLDAPPAERWLHITQDYAKYGPGIMAYLESYIPKEFVPIIEKIAADIDTYFPQPFADELKGVAKGYGLKLGDAVIVNLIYQLEGIGVNCSARNNTGPCPSMEMKKRGPGLCTSIVAEDENGMMFHGRNLDWSIPAILRKTMIDVDYVKGGKIIFTASQPAGFVGILHGVRHGGWSYSMDARDVGGKLLPNLLQALLMKSMTPTQHIRKIMEEEAEFDGAIEKIAKGPIINPAYFIVGGPNDEATVVTRGREEAVDYWKLKDPAFYLLETNYDHWKTPPSYDDRRKYGIEMMNKIGGKAGVNHDSLFKVMTSWPLFNHHTDFTNVYSAANSSMYQTLIWD